MPQVQGRSPVIVGKGNSSVFLTWAIQSGFPASHLSANEITAYCTSFSEIPHCRSRKRLSVARELMSREGSDMASSEVRSQLAVQPERLELPPRCPDWSLLHPQVCLAHLSARPSSDPGFPTLRSWSLSLQKTCPGLLSYQSTQFSADFQTIRETIFIVTWN